MMESLCNYALSSSDSDDEEIAPVLSNVNIAPEVDVDILASVAQDERRLVAVENGQEKCLIEFDDGEAKGRVHNGWMGRTECIDVDETMFDQVLHERKELRRKRLRERNPRPLSNLQNDDDDDDDDVASDDESISSSFASSSSAKRQKVVHNVDADSLAASALDQAQSEIEKEKEKEKEKSESESELEKVEQDDEGDEDETSKLHGSEPLFDYRGRSFASVPARLWSRLDNPLQRCRVPRKAVHTWRGHVGAVSTVRLFPRSGHLMLSAGVDGKVKVWDVYEKRAVRRTYAGHTKALRSAEFDADGRRFVSASHDGFVKVWDTESGACVHRFRPGGTPMVAKVHESAAQQHVLMVGGTNRQALQYDTRANEVVQRYNHLDTVNTITFIDECRQLVTTSDDKTMRVWDYGLPVETRNIADAGMQSMPAVAVSPDGAHIVCQSLDNRALVFATAPRVAQKRSRVFRGHQVAGYACELAFSPCGSYLMSGSFNGHLGALVVWDWRSCRIVAKLPAHQGAPCISARWHPLESSQIVTCGWDGLIKLWQ
jgi:WD40 repeat protein